jgi:hypothetical protein
MSKYLGNLTLVIGLILSVQVVAAATVITNYKPLLYRNITSGFVRPENAQSSKCEIFPTYYRLITVKNKIKNLTMRKLVIPEDLTALILEVSKGEVTYRPAPADIGSQIYGAYIKLDTYSFLSVDLGSTRDSQTISTNANSKSLDLKEFIDQVCVE